MKPLHVALLIAAGAIGGAVVMKVAQKPQPAVPAVVAQSRPASPEAPAPSPVAPAAPAAPAAVVEPEAQHPSPFQAALQTPRSAPERQARRPVPLRTYQPTRKPAAVAVAQAAPAAVSPPPVSTPEPPPEPVASPSVPPTVSPARLEPENVTPPPPPAPPEPHRVTLNAGTLIPVRLVEGLSSERSMPGDSFTATLDKELVVDGFVIAERGARVEGRVVAADRGGKVSGLAALSVEITRLRTADGQNVAIQTETFAKHADDSKRQDATKVGAGAAIGAAIGAIAGGGKGAAIGAGVGAGAGAGDVLLTRGNPATLPSETRINFRLRAPVTLTERLRG